MRALIVCLLIIPLGVFPGAAYAAPTDPEIIIYPEAPILLGDPLSIVLRGVPPHTEAILHAQRYDDDSAWYAWAVFTAPDYGIVELDTRVPLRGTYEGADSSGLFWSMQRDVPPSCGRVTEIQRVPKGPVYLDLEVDGEVVATTSIELLDMAPELATTPIDREGTKGRYYRLPTPNENPTVILLGDLEQGERWANDIAALLASHGYPSLALSYWDAPGLPETYENIPIEYVEDAITWLRGFQHPNRRHVILMGHGRGAELALLTAAHDGRVSGVIAYAPPSIPFQGLGRGIGQLIPRSPYSLNGVSIAYARTGYPLSVLGQVLNPFRDQINMCTTHTKALDSATVQPIEAERIRGPILLFSGEDDAYWPATQMAARLQARLDNADHGYYYAHVAYPEAGHAIGATGYRPTTDNSAYRFAQGGTPAADAQAQQDSWQRVLRFLGTEFTWQVRGAMP